MSEGFLTNIRTAELFFRVCARYRVTSREDRLAMMRKLANRNKARYLRDVRPFLDGKKVLKIVPKKETK